jgi:hypothetical protein
MKNKIVYYEIIREEDFNRDKNGKLTLKGT